MIASTHFFHLVISLSAIWTIYSICNLHIFKTFALIGKDDEVTLMNLGIKVGFLKMVSSFVGIELGLKGSYDRFSISISSISGFTLQGVVGVSSFIF